MKTKFRLKQRKQSLLTNQQRYNRNLILKLHPLMQTVMNVMVTLSIYIPQFRFDLVLTKSFDMEV